MMKRTPSALTSRHPRLARGSGSASARLVKLHVTAGRPSGSPRKAGMTGLFIAALLFAFATPARAEQVSMQGTLMVANVAGECDVLYSMVDFQKKNNIKGGEEYVAKFWANEAAKMNISVEQLSDRCSKSTTAYDKLWDTFAVKAQGSASGNE